MELTVLGSEALRLNHLRNMGSGRISDSMEKLSTGRSIESDSLEISPKMMARLKNEAREKVQSFDAKELQQVIDSVEEAGKRKIGISALKAVVSLILKDPDKLSQYVDARQDVLENQSYAVEKFDDATAAISQNTKDPDNEQDTLAADFFDVTRKLVNSQDGAAHSAAFFDAARDIAKTAPDEMDSFLKTVNQLIDVDPGQLGNYFATRAKVSKDVGASTAEFDKATVTIAMNTLDSQATHRTSLNDFFSTTRQVLGSADSASGADAFFQSSAQIAVNTTGQDLPAEFFSQVNRMIPQYADSVEKYSRAAEALSGMTGMTLNAFKDFNTTFNSVAGNSETTDLRGKLLDVAVEIGEKGTLGDLTQFNKDVQMALSKTTSTTTGWTVSVSTGAQIEFIPGVATWQIEVSGQYQKSITEQATLYGQVNGTLDAWDTAMGSSSGDNSQTGTQSAATSASQGTGTQSISNVLTQDQLTAALNSLQDQIGLSFTGSLATLDAGNLSATAGAIETSIGQWEAQYNSIIREIRNIFLPGNQESAILDIDYAAELTRIQKNQVILSDATALMSQAVSDPNLILRLLS